MIGWLVGPLTSSCSRIDPTSDITGVLVRMAAIDETEMRELVIDAWRMVVLKSIADAHAHAD